MIDTNKLDSEELGKRYQQALKRFANTPDGKLVLDVLRMLYVKGSVMTGSSETTHYCLGQKECIEQIIETATSEVTTTEELINE